MKEDIIDIEIMDDGLIKSTTPKISASNHAGAHEFFRYLARFTGGATSASKAKHSHTHGHDHQHDHDTLKGGN